MDVDSWFRAAMADADGRGLADLGPLLEGLRHAQQTLRRREWSAAARDEPDSTRTPGAVESQPRAEPRTSKAAAELPADSIGALARQGPGLKLVLVDDQSVDGTVAVAAGAALAPSVIVSGDRGIVSAYRSRTSFFLGRRAGISGADRIA